MSRALLSLGSNLGDRYANLRAAVAALAPHVLATSGVYATAPWGDPDQPDYYNAVTLVDDPGATAGDWLRRAQRIEVAAGRVRDPARRFGPRTLDVDVIMVWAADGAAVRSNDPDLTLPHPRAHLRAFVLRPWLDLEPDADLPGHGPVRDLLATEPLAAQAREVRLLPGLPLESAR